MKKLIKDLVVGDTFDYCNKTYVVQEILNAGQLLAHKTTHDCGNSTWYSLFSRTNEVVGVYVKTKLKDLSVGDKFKYTNPYSNNKVRTVLYKDDVAILYVSESGEYVLTREGDLSGLLSEEVEVIPYVEEA